jgi:polysaccharide export outer membrane protein
VVHPSKPGGDTFLLVTMLNSVCGVSSFFLLVSLLAATAAAGQAQPRNQTPQQTAPPGQPTTQAQSVPEASRPSDYTIGPEDVLGIVFWREPDMSGDVTVRPDGRITIPVIGEMQAAGQRPDELQEAIAAAASKYISSVNVVVVVRTINSRKIFVTGRVTTPGTYPIMGPLTVMQAIALAGGLTEYADPKNITILRIENGKSRTMNFNYQDIARGKSLEQNIQLKPGDTVVVP